jgi:hypothetical protein
MNASRSADQLEVSRVMAAAESPEEVPKNSASAGTKSLVESPCRYRSGRTSATFGERRAYGGRMELRNRERSPVAGSARPSSTRGAATSRTPAPATTVLGLAWPLRTTRARPRLSQASRCRCR